MESVKRISPEISAAYSRTVLKGNEVLVNVRGTLGGVAVVPEAMRGWNVSREVAVVPVLSEVDSKFVAYWIASSRSQKWLSGVEKGVAYTGINLEDLRLLPIALPPLAEQQEIVRCAEGLFAIADALEERCSRANVQVNKLIISILAKAFRGELVPQLASDEPASSLLERILSSRMNQPLKIRRKPTRMKIRDLSTDSVKEVIEQLPEAQFSFGDLRAAISGDYNTLKELVFELLAEARPMLKQVFDSDTQSMHFERINR